MLDSNQNGSRQKRERDVSPVVHGLSHPSMHEYYRRLRRLLFVGLLIAFLVPLAILSLYFHFQFNVTLKESGKFHLTTLAESERNTVDLFLQERVVNIFNLFHTKYIHKPPSPDDMTKSLQQLLEMNDAFVDIGFLDSSGMLVGYAGPYAFLRGRDYSHEQWFQTLMLQNQNYYISDIYLGFRQRPHFTIAVKQNIEGNVFVVRATLDPDKFYHFIRTIGQGKVANCALINREGKYQVVDPGAGGPLGISQYMPPTMSGSGANEVTMDGNPELFAYAWLKEVPWVLVIRQPLRIAYAEMYRVRTIMITATLAFVFLLAAITWFTTYRLIRRAEATDESRKELKSQLFHAAKLVAVGELAGGVAHEINNPLAIISSESGVIRDMFDPQFKLECTPEKVLKELDYIDEAVFRARDITQKLLNFVRRTEPSLRPYNVNTLLEEVVGGLKEREFKVSDITVVRHYDPSVPEIMIDPDQMRQVFLNMINNAGDAITGSGTITLSTKRNEESAHISISDTGKGMTSEQLQRIFDPFYTTKEVGKGTGLGLSISLNIVQAMGGRIDVQSMPGAGSCFTVILPQQGGRT